MIVVGNTIVSDDVADRRFGCPIAQCKGACCVEGDGGAPLLDSEVAALKAVLPIAEPYMTPEGRAAVNQQGVAVRDSDGDLGTPLIDGGACAYVTQEEGGLVLCAIEKAFRSAAQAFPHPYEGFVKPVSCHLYPLRVQDFGEFTAINYHHWDICRCARGQGDVLYQALREPLIRRFGQDWYNELVEQIKLQEQHE